MKELVREKKLNIWREVVEKANTDFDGVGKSSALLKVGDKKEEEEEYSFVEE